MNRRVRTHCKSSSSSSSSSWKRGEEEVEVEKGFYRFLKPGALAQLRDSRISARSHRKPNNLQISLLHIASNYDDDDDDRRTTTTATELIEDGGGGLPCFSGSRVFSPRCPQRKKLVASKAIYFLSSDSDSDINVLSNDTTDLLVSH